VAALLAERGVEAIPAGPEEPRGAACRTPGPSAAEFLEHLDVGAAATAAWPVLFPGPGGHGLRFSASFEGGNLCRARLDAGGALELLLWGDTNRAHCQWFFFEVEVDKPVVMRFRIVNLTKPSSTFAEGQRAVALAAGDTCWRRAGIDYACFPNRYSLGGFRRHFTLAFTLQLGAGRTRIAHFYPYLLGDLLADLRKLRPAGDWLDVRDIGPTPGGRPLLMLAITDFSAGSAEERAGRQRVVVSARVHPGEAPASFVLRGVLESLLSDSEEAEVLRRHFVFVVLPMLNPDGVAAGNGRSSSSGEDLNRCWEHPREGSEVAAARSALEGLCLARGGVLALLDLHAHSGRHGAFTLSNRGTTALPNLLAASGSPLFDRGQCTFSCTRAKRGSARCVAWRELGVPHAHTIEATYAALPGRARLVAPADLVELGHCLVRACGQLGNAPAPPVLAAEAGLQHGRQIRQRCRPERRPEG